MRKIVVGLIFVIVAASLGAQTIKDGLYFAQDSEYASNGWKNQAILEVKGGKINKANWNGVGNLPGVVDKKAYDMAGKYNMVKFGKAKAEWYQQALVVEEYLVKTQDTAFSKYSNSEGKTDAITGASIAVKEYFDLAKKALAAGPVAKGMYAKDGWHYAAQAAFDAESGWKDTVLLTVVNGTVVDAVWNGISKDTKKKSKIVESATGKYAMVKFGKSQSEWHTQATLAEAALVKAQDPKKIPQKGDGKTDAVTGVSIAVSGFLALAEEALKATK